MSALEQIKKDTIVAMKGGDKQLTQALRLIANELQKDQKEGKGDEIAVLQRERKRRLESLEAFQNAGRTEQAQAEKFEVGIIEGYLPKPLDPNQLKILVEEAIAQTGANSPKDMGKVMGYLKPKVAGRADGRTLSTMVKEALA